MTISKSIVQRDELMFMLSLERTFIDRWIAGGEGAIPQMPHLPDLGKGTRFHLPSVEKWLLDNFQRGGVFAAAKQKGAA